MNSFGPLGIDNLGESEFELEGALYLYREAMAQKYRGAGDGSARADEVEALRARVRGCVGNLRIERAMRAQESTHAEAGEWTPLHYQRLDELLGADARRVKRIVGVLGFEDEKR